MAIIREHPDAFTLVVVLDLPEKDCDAILDLVRERVEEDIRYVPGFLAGTWYEQVPHGIGADLGAQAAPAGCRRIAEYIQWSDKASCQAFLADSTLSRHMAKVDEVAVQVWWRGYEVRNVISAGDQARTLSFSPDVITQVVRHDIVPGKLDRVIEQTVAQTERVTRHLPGFVGSALHVGHDGGVVEFVQWDSAEHLRNAYADPEYSEHIGVVSRYATSDWGLYGLLRTIDGADPLREETLSS